MWRCIWAYPTLIGASNVGIAICRMCLMGRRAVCLLVCPATIQHTVGVPTLWSRGSPDCASSANERWGSSTIHQHLAMHRGCRKGAVGMGQDVRHRFFSHPNGCPLRRPLASSPPSSTPSSSPSSSPCSLTLSTRIHAGLSQRTAFLFWRRLLPRSR